MRTYRDYYPQPLSGWTKHAVPKRIMHGQLVAQGSEGAGRTPEQWGGNQPSEKPMWTGGSFPRKGVRRKWFVYGVETDDAHDCATAGGNMGKWHLGVKKGAEEFKSTWRREHRRESDRRHKREAATWRTVNQRTALSSTTTARAREESKMEMAEGMTRFVPD
ncbi:unnamed protein product [Sphacelaria rigidula]